MQGGEAESRPNASEPTTKASSRGYAKRNVCPNCRNKKPPAGPKDGDGTGAGGSSSASVAQPQGVTARGNSTERSEKLSWAGT
ncbi:predicted protein [Histoplasma mississippiense (nom. inval.)]|uniref:predicted protein n=1 Tax=Ajellomyces capsulatus (strain NAm1 / WU24) TaxID=2059318 RepID=UPI000157BD5E|nr:predicted protein [Histoplasma mississippiense (nom. inval.)]EDN05940.1 predicted protein [Histoplasma mississippiense (nom. inval.)]